MKLLTLAAYARYCSSIEPEPDKYSLPNGVFLRRSCSSSDMASKPPAGTSKLYASSLSLLPACIIPSLPSNSTSAVSTVLVYGPPFLGGSVSISMPSWPNLNPRPMGIMPPPAKLTSSPSLVVNWTLPPFLRYSYRRPPAFILLPYFIVNQYRVFSSHAGNYSPYP